MPAIPKDTSIAKEKRCRVWFAAWLLAAVGSLAGGGGLAAADDGSVEEAGPTASAPAPAPAPVVREIVIHADRPRPAFEGWGTSLCWWAHGVGDWPDERLDPLIDWIVDPDEGLGYTIFRYNIGGGDDPSHDHMRRDGDVPGYRASPDAAYDWTADANQRRVLQKLAAQVEAPILEAFANSPPYWMTISGCASGNTNGLSNLRDDMYDDFAGYLADVVEHFHREWGVTFRTVNPLNEPNASWWKAGHTQEGCHFDVQEQDRIIQALRGALDKRGLTQVQVSAPDSNSMDTCVANLRAYDPATMAALGQINTHSYHGDQRDALRRLAAGHGKRLWQSESGPLGFHGSPMDAALFMAERVVRDLNELQPAAWLEWQVVAGGTWGCIHVDRRSDALTRSPSFHAYATFSRAIRPGDRLLAVEPGEVVAAYSPTRGELVIVAANASDSARRYRCRFEGLAGHAPRAQRHSAFGDQGPDSVAFTGDALTLTVPARAVVRWWIPQVRLAAKAAAAAGVKTQE